MSENYKHSWEIPNDMDNTTTSTHSIALEAFYERKANHTTNERVRGDRMSKHDEARKIVKTNLHWNERKPMLDYITDMEAMEKKYNELKSFFDKLRLVSDLDDTDDYEGSYTFEFLRSENTDVEFNTTDQELISLYHEITETPTALETHLKYMEEVYKEEDKILGEILKKVGDE